MADIVLSQGSSLPATTQSRYRDMGDGTHALIVDLDGSVSGGSDIVLPQGSSVPLTMRSRYVDQGDATHAQQFAYTPETPTRLLDYEQFLLSFVANGTVPAWWRFNEQAGTTLINYGYVRNALNAVWAPGVGSLGNPVNVADLFAYDYDGANSINTVPNDASINALTAFTHGYLVRPDGPGELNSGRFFSWTGNTYYLRFQGALGVVNAVVDAVGDALSVTSSGLAANQWAWVFETYDHTGDRLIRLYHGQNAAITEFGYTIQNASVGALAALAGTLTLGNLVGGAVTFDGEFAAGFIANEVWSVARMTELVRLSGA